MLFKTNLFKLNNLNIIHDLYSQCLTQILSKMTFFFCTEGVHVLSRFPTLVLIMEPELWICARYTTTIIFSEAVENDFQRRANPTASNETSL